MKPDLTHLDLKSAGWHHSWSPKQTLTLDVVLVRMQPSPFFSSRAELVTTDSYGIFYQLKASTGDCTVRRTQSGVPPPSRWWRSKADVNTLEGVAGVRWICLSLSLHRYDWPNEIYGELSLSFSYITHTLAGAHNPLWNCPQTRSLGWMIARADVPDNRASLTPPPHLVLNAMLLSGYAQRSPVMAEHI